MSTAAGNLVVTLMARTGQFEKGMRRSGQHTVAFSGQVQQMSGVLSQVHPALGRVAGMLTGPVGVAGAAMAAAYAFRRLAAESEAIVSQADRLGMGTEFMERLQHAADRTGTSFGAVTSAWQKLRVELGRGETGQRADLLRSIGLDPEALRAGGSEEAFRRVAESISGIADPTERARLQYDLFGRSGTELDAVLRRTAQGLDEVAVVSGRTRLAMSDLENEWQDFRHSFGVRLREGLGDAVANAREMAAFIRGGAEGLRDHIRLQEERVRQMQAEKAAQADIARIEEERREAERRAQQRTTILDRLQRDVDVMKFGADAVAITEFRDLGGDVAAMQELVQERNRLAEAAEREQRAADATRQAEERRRGVLQSLRDEAERMWMGADAFAIRDLEGPQREEAEALQADIRRMRDMEDMERRGREMTRSLETPAEALERRLKEIEELASKGAIDAETRRRALEQLHDEHAPEAAGPARFAGAMQRDSREAMSAILAAMGGGRDDPARKTAENTKATIEQLKGLRDKFSELIAIERDQQEVEIPPA